MQLLLLLSLLLLVAGAPSAHASEAAPAPAASDAAQWRALSVSDIEEAYSLFRDEHPGMHDRGNPGFPAQLERSRREALALAERMSGAQDYPAVLAAFSAPLGDGHALVHPTRAFEEQVPDSVSWPGFVANWRGSAMLVSRAKPELAHLTGARVVACDGIPAAELVLRNTFDLDGRAAEPGQWWWRAHRLFLDSPGRGLALVGAQPPRQCDFLGPDGTNHTETLTWRPLESAAETWFRETRSGTPTPIGLTMPRPGIWLVGLSDFSPDERGREAYESLFADLTERHEELAGARAIMLDLRGNNGGSSHWPTRVAEHLWGEDFVRAARASHYGNVEIHWRASEGHRAYLVSLMNSDTFPEVFRQFLHRLLSLWDDALASGQPLVVQPESPGNPSVPTGPAPPRLADVPVFVALDGGCASACNDALDTFTRFPGTRLMGAPSSADTRYMDVRSVITASGMARVILPMKIWVGRPARPGPADTYAPHVTLESADWSTDRFLDLVEAQLTARAQR
ncbi:MAG: hypothetical protein ACK4MX_05220 [Thermaurantiacus sp.]